MEKPSRAGRQCEVCSYWIEPDDERCLRCEKVLDDIYIDKYFKDKEIDDAEECTW
jgi:hypothetical protein